MSTAKSNVIIPQMDSTQMSMSQNIPLNLVRLYPKLKKRITAVPLFRIGDIVAERWIISGLIGHGGYGQIFFAKDSREEELKGVAIKTELKMRKGKIAKRMILEQKVLLRLQGRAHVPLLWGSGSTSKVNYIIMQLLSQNINDIRKQSPFKRFSRPTMARIVIQGIAGLRDMHQIGYIHRDIKPHNLCFGLSEVSKHRLVIIDYGLARRFRHSNGQLRPLREDCGFRGTTVYASLRAHEGKDLGPSDDLTSLFYVAIEMILGYVPWKHARRNEEVKALKEAIQEDDFQSVTKKVGRGLREFGRAVYSMDADDEPNYTSLQNTMLDFTKDRRLSDPYDWDNNFEDVIREHDINRMISKKA
ncbi:putative casein kinase [Dirofilaria immitis]